MVTETSSPARPQGEGAGPTGSSPAFETPALKRLLEAAAAREARSAPQHSPPAPEPPKSKAPQPEPPKAAAAVAERAPASWPEASDWFDQPEPASAPAQPPAAAPRRALAVERRHAPTWPKRLQHPAVPITLIVVALAIALWLMIFSA